MNQRLRKARKDMHWSMEDACDQLRVSVLTYSRWEHGTQYPRGYNLALLCKVFDRSAVELGFEEDLYERQKGQKLNYQEEMPACSPVPIEEDRVSYQGEVMNNADLTRRTLLQSIAATGTAAIGVQSLGNPEPWERLATRRTTDLDGETIQHFEKLMHVSWKLTDGRDMETAGQILHLFLPKLTQVAPYHPEAAKVAADCLRLQSIHASHKLDNAKEVVLGQQSIEIARLTRDSNALTAALAASATIFRVNGKNQDALNACFEGLSYARQVTPLVRTRLYQETAMALAKDQRWKEAHFYVGLAYEAYPSKPEEDPYAASGIFNISFLDIYDGIIHLEEGRPTEARKIFTSIQKTGIPGRAQLEVINNESRLALLENDKQWYAACLQKGAQEALAMNSQKRLKEVSKIFNVQVPVEWKKEAALTGLAEQYGLVTFS